MTIIKMPLKLNYIETVNYIILAIAVAKIAKYENWAAKKTNQNRLYGFKFYSC